MNILSVNCRACGQPEVVQELRHLVEIHKPALVFMMETKLEEEKALDLKRSLGFPNGLAVAARGLSGGLALFWRGDIIVTLQNKSKSHIDVIVSSDTVGIRQWRITGFYGEPRRELRKNSWYLMKFLRAQLDLPWLCVGDFNEVLESYEHIGGNGRDEWKMAGFREAVAECKLNDLGYTGLPYTWDNRQEGDRNVKVRLDRALGDDKFMDSLGATSVHHVQLAESDHCALLVKVKAWEEAANQGGGKVKPFRYENMWQRHEGYMDFVRQEWGSSGGIGLAGISATLNSLQGSLQS